MSEESDFQLADTRPKTKGFMERYLILPKLLYFSLNMAVYSTYYVTSNYFKEVWNIPIHHYGYISGLTTLGVFGSIFWTVLADKTRAHKLILICTALGFCASFLFLRLESLKHSTFWIKMIFVCFMYSLSNFFVSALYPLLDSCVFNMLSKDPEFSTKLYGKQRLWGSVGQAVISQLNAVMITKTSMRYHSIFVNLLWSTTVFITCVYFGIPKNISLKETSKKKRNSVVPIDMAIKSDPQDKVPPHIPINPIRQLLSNSHFLMFIVIIFAAGFVRSILGNFLPYYLDFDAKQTTTLYMLAMQTKIISEVAFYFMGKPILTLLGTFWVMMLGLLTGTVRVAGYALITPAFLNKYHLTFPLEFLKGINNACIITAGVRIAHALAPTGCETVAQGFFSGIQSNLSNAAAGFVGGLILEIYRSDAMAMQKLFTLTSIFGTISCLLYGLIQLVRPFPNERTQ